MEKPYVPINCDFYDELLALATLRRRAEIRYRDEAGRTVAVEDYIEDVFTKGAEEFVRLRGGAIIRLDRLAQVDGKQPPEACAPPEADRPA